MGRYILKRRETTAERKVRLLAGTIKDIEHLTRVLCAAKESQRLAIFERIKPHLKFKPPQEGFHIPMGEEAHAAD